MVVRCDEHDAWEDNPRHGGRICHECHHSFQTAKELRQSYRRGWDQLAASLWRELRHPESRTELAWHVGDVFAAAPFMTGWQIEVGWLKSRLIRASKIDFCVHCLHDF